MTPELLQALRQVLLHSARARWNESKARNLKRMRKAGESVDEDLMRKHVISESVKRGRSLFINKRQWAN